MVDGGREKRISWRIEIDYLGQAPLKAVLGNRDQRSFDFDYARLMHSGVRPSPRNLNP